MIKKTVTYNDYNGKTRTEDFYFNLTEEEIVMMQVSEDEGFDQHLKRIIAENNQNKIIKMFKEIVLMAYGVKSEDGRTHVKNDNIRQAFVSNPAYSQIFMELAFDDAKAAEFIKGIMPPNMQSQLDAEMAKINVLPGGVNA